MSKYLVVVDMQNDFIDGSLGTPEAQAILPKVIEKIKNFKGAVVYTRDTHDEDYLETLEGKNLPVEHCIRETAGWKLIPKLRPLTADTKIIQKPTFGSTQLSYLVAIGDYEEIELIGLCTDVCVISNALLLKATVPETPITVDASCCAGVTPQSHKTALDAMKMCQIIIKE